METAAICAFGQPVAESGIHTREDVERLKTCGAKAVLIGESMMREDNIAAKVEELIGLE